MYFCLVTPITNIQHTMQHQEGKDHLKAKIILTQKNYMAAAKIIVTSKIMPMLLVQISNLQKKIYLIDF